MRRFLVFAVALSTGCIDSHWVSAEDPRPTRFVLEPASAELATIAEEWVERWRNATGVDITVGVGGFPLAFRDNLKAKGCAETHSRHRASGAWYQVEGVFLDPTPRRGCPEWQLAIGHELGHVIAGPRSEHADTGVFSKWLGPVWVGIDEGTLDTVCTAAPCTTFAPEPQ